MAKSIYLSDEQYKAIVKAAQSCGYTVKRGCNSQLAKFIVDASKEKQGGVNQMKPRILDTFCKAGGAAVGYNRAGWDVVGIDIEPQKHYPFPFILGDALDILRRMIIGREIFSANDGNWYGIEHFDAIHASPVCKGYSVMKSLWKEKEYPDQVAETRDILQMSGLPYIIENVKGAPLKNYVTLCGSMFGLRVYRHRLFECNPAIYFPPMACNHHSKASGNKNIKGHRKNANILTVTGHDFILDDAKNAMGIDWMNQAEISQAIPPAYTEFIGKRMKENIRLGCSQ